MAPLVDVHQHIWTRPLVDALAARDAAPFVRRSRGLTILHATGEQPYLIDEEAEAPARRAELVRADGLDVAIVAPSSPIGLEALQRTEASELIAAHLEGVSALPAQFLHWGPVALDSPDPADVDELLAAGCLGVSLPAGAFAGRAALDAAGALLERAAERGAPVFVHPGSAREAGQETSHMPSFSDHPRSSGDQTGTPDPSWWPALTGYVAQMQAAWLTFVAYGRPIHPELTVVFAMLAGGAPLLAERLVTRGGPHVELRDPLTFYDTSSYGPIAVETMARIVGAEQLVYGSDRPFLEPLKTGREQQLQENAGGLIAGLARQGAVEGAG